METDALAPRQNRILARLTPAVLDAMRDDLQPVALELGHVVYEADKPFGFVYFMVSGVVSILAVAPDETGVEVATVGSEGMAGLPAFLGARKAALRAFVQIPGGALRMRADRFEMHCNAHEDLRRVMLAYTQAFITQVAQSSGCNRMHPVEERCARWILLTHDRVDGDEFPLTQQFLAQMLGVRRATVGSTANALREAGLITYSRGSMCVVDRAGLEEAACECYEIVESEYKRLLGGPPEKKDRRKPRAKR